MQISILLRRMLSVCLCLMCIALTSSDSLGQLLARALSRSKVSGGVLSTANRFRYKRKDVKSHGQSSGEGEASADGVVHFSDGSHPSPDAPVYDIRCQESNAYANKLPVSAA